MKKLYTLAITMLCSANLFAQAICDPTANVIIFSNYDGGTLNINIDQNIPNIKIGITSYEAAAINITGTYAGNVTEVRYAGYNSTNNTNCSPNVPSTSITGVPAQNTSILSYPASTYSNTNGYQYIICNYSCDDQTNQGGCNTPDQIVHYFVTNFGGALYSHHTQYGCWNPSTTYAISAGGNCCISPFATSISENEQGPQLTVMPVPADGLITISAKGTGNARIDIVNLLGEVVMSGIEPGLVDISSLPEGVYLARVMTEGKIIVRKFVAGR
jgi:hypothetical protein